jgi:nitrite reductase/ring-hydroxylating ferredoxin subunit
MTGTYKVGSLDGFPVGTFRMVVVEGRDIGILRMKNGDIHAIKNACPHKTAPVCRGHLGGTWPPSNAGELQFNRDGEVLVCPRHGWEFDIKTGVELFQERPSHLVKYETRIEGNEVLVTL